MKIIGMIVRLQAAISLAELQPSGAIVSYISHGYKYRFIKFASRLEARK
jgi:hypothetical protein